MALESYLYRNKVAASTLYDMALNALLNNEDVDLAGDLLRAFWTMVGEDVPSYESVHERFADYRKVYAQEYLGRLPEAEDEIWEPHYPEVPLPRPFVVMVAKVRGQRDKQARKMMADLNQEMDAAKASLSPESFKTRYGFYPSSP